MGSPVGERTRISSDDTGEKRASKANGGAKPAGRRKSVDSKDGGLPFTAAALREKLEAFTEKADKVEAVTNKKEGCAPCPCSDVC